MIKPAKLETTPSGRSGAEIRLLLTEDNPVNQLLTKSMLANFGYLVDLASNGLEALYKLSHNDYALVLMDCMMPEMDGYQATEIIRDPTSTVRNQAIPVIALTANAFKEDRDICLAVGMNDYLAKPVEVSELLSMLEKWIPSASPDNVHNSSTSAAELE